jgi:hypothetical protein
MSFNVTVKPKLFGIYESTRARIKYNSGSIEIDGVDPDVRHGYSTSLGFYVFYMLSIFSFCFFKKKSTINSNNKIYSLLIYERFFFFTFL